MYSRLIIDFNQEGSRNMFTLIYLCTTFGLLFSYILLFKSKLLYFLITYFKNKMQSDKIKSLVRHKNKWIVFNLQLKYNLFSLVLLAYFI